MASDDQANSSLRLKDPFPSCPPLPYIPPSFPGEMLSSWLRRIAAEYRIDLQHLAGHIGLSTSRARQIDSALTAEDIFRVALALHSHPAEIRDMVHPSRVRVLRATSAPLQVCAQCQARFRAATRLPVAIRAWFELWQIDCQHCQTPFSPAGAAKLTRCNPAREDPAWFESLRPAARAGAQLLANFARRPFAAGFSPIAVLRLLSMRFDAVRFAHMPVAGHSFAAQLAIRRLAELFVPGLSERWRDDLIPEPWTADRPVRLVTARTILLAGMANFLRDRVQAVDLIQSVAACVNHRGFYSLLISMRAVAGEPGILHRSWRGSQPSSLTIWSNSETDQAWNSQISCRNGVL